MISRVAQTTLLVVLAMSCDAAEDAEEPAPSSESTRPGNQEVGVDPRSLREVVASSHTVVVGTFAHQESGAVPYTTPDGDLVRDVTWLDFTPRGIPSLMSSPEALGELNLAPPRPGQSMRIAVSGRYGESVVRTIAASDGRRQEFLVFASPFSAGGIDGWGISNGGSGIYEVRDNEVFVVEGPGPLEDGAALDAVIEEITSLAAELLRAE